MSVTEHTPDVPLQVRPLASRLGMEQKTWRMLSVVLGGALLAFFAAGWHTYRSVESEMTESTLARRASIAYLAAATLSGRFERVIDVGVSLATRVRFRDLIAAGRWKEAGDILRNVPSDFRYIERVFLTDDHGTLMADIPESPGLLGTSFIRSGWYVGVSRHWNPHVSSVYQRAAPRERNVFAVAVPIRGAGEIVLGILVIEVNLDVFFEWTQAVDLGPRGLVYVVDRRRQLAFHPGFSAQMPLRDLGGNSFVEKLSRGETGVEVGASPIDGEMTVSAFVPARHGWGVVAQQFADDAFETRDSQLQRVIAGFALILALCAGLVVLATHLLLRRRQAHEDQRVKAELERRVAERTEQLQAANKELESFTYSVSHDLRAPLRAIDGYAHILDEDYGAQLEGEGRRLLGVVRSSTTQMGRLIDDLLEFSRLGRRPIPRDPVDMGALAREVAADLARETPAARIDIGALPAARGDRALLRQVWFNLIANALKYSGTRERPEVEVGGRADGAENVYWVRDKGVGFDMRYYDKLFGVFQRLHAPGEFPGTGVGLAIVHRVVTRHGGRVWAEGKVGDGACFSFALPRNGGDS